MTKFCPVCKSENTEKYLDVNIPTFLFPVPKNLIKKIDYAPFHLMICNACSHIFQVDIDQKRIETIYNEFYKHYNQESSEQSLAVYKDRFIEFFNEMNPTGKNKKLLDIGCGEGFLFQFYEKSGFQIYGIDPSENIKIAMKRSPNAHLSNEFFEKNNRNIFREKMDVILMNLVLEHVINLDSFFEKLNQYTKRGTKLIVQVPNIDYYIDNNVRFFFAHEHINYFTRETLKVLLERKGFKIIGQTEDNIPSLIICGEFTGIENNKKIENWESVKKKKKFIKSGKNLQKKINKIMGKYENIIIYGVGLSAFWILTECMKNVNQNKIRIIDDNTHYWNKIVPGFGKKLDPPKNEKLKNALILITTSPVYHKKIEDLIRKRYTGEYKILEIEKNEVKII